MMRRQFTGRLLGCVFGSALAAALGAAPAGAGEVKAAPGWATTEEYKKALEVAKEKNRPVAVLYAFRSSTCPKHNSMAASVMASKSLQGAVRVLVYTDDKLADVNAMRVQAEGSNIIPWVFLLDPQGRLTSFVDYGRRDQLTAEASKLAQLMKWQEKAKKQLAKADAAAAAGRYGAALKLVDEVAAQDRAATETIEYGLAHEGAVPAPAPKSKAGGKSKKNRADASADTSASGATAGAAEASGRYFPDLAPTKRAEYEKLAAERLAKAQALADAKDTAGALRLLAPMVADAAELESVKGAGELFAQLKPAAKGAAQAGPKAGKPRA